MICDKKRAKILTSTSSIYDRPLSKRKVSIEYSKDPSNVSNITLSHNEITASCNLSNSIENISCSDSVKVVDILTIANDPDGSSLTYNYTITGGKIIGNGAKVQWDLSGVKAGTYTITAAVDDGCGFCGKAVTKTVTVKECSNCKL